MHRRARADKQNYWFQLHPGSGTRQKGMLCKNASDIGTKSFIAFFCHRFMKYGAKDATTGDWNGKQSAFSLNFLFNSSFLQSRHGRGSHEACKFTAVGVEG